MQQRKYTLADTHARTHTHVGCIVLREMQESAVSLKLINGFVYARMWSSGMPECGLKNTHQYSLHSCFHASFLRNNDISAPTIAEKQQVLILFRYQKGSF